jgi:hypothetical protein
VTCPSNLSVSCNVHHSQACACMQINQQQHEVECLHAQTVMASACAAALEHGRTNTRATTNTVLDSVAALSHKKPSELASLAAIGISSLASAWCAAPAAGGQEEGQPAGRAAVAAGAVAKRPGAAVATGVRDDRTNALGGKPAATGSGKQSWLYAQALSTGLGVLGAMAQAASESGVCSR